MAEKRSAAPDRGDDKEAESDPLARRAGEDRLSHFQRLKAEARFGDPKVVAAAEDAERDLMESSRSPDPHRPEEADARADLVVTLVGDGLPDDASDPRWLDLARALGVPLEEIVSIGGYQQGVIVQHKDGNWYIFVGSDNPPDANGKRGVFLLTRPPRYAGPFPVYSEPPEQGQQGLTTGSVPPRPAAPPIPLTDR